MLQTSGHNKTGCCESRNAIYRKDRAIIADSAIAEKRGDNP